MKINYEKSTYWLLDIAAKCSQELNKYIGVGEGGIGEATTLSPMPMHGKDILNRKSTILTPQKYTIFLFRSLQ